MPTATPPFYGTQFGDLVIAGYRVGDLIVMREVQYGAIGVAAFLLLLIIVLIISGGKKKKKRKEAEPQESSGMNLIYETGKVISVAREPVAPMDEGEKTIDVYGNGEETINPFSEGNGEETINPFGGEETISPNWQPETMIKFTVSADGETYDQEVSFTDKMEIGRDASCQLSLKPKYISRHHLELATMPDGVFMRNLTAERSEKYTFLNRVEVGESYVPVNSGDTLEIAQTRITIEILSR